MLVTWQPDLRGLVYWSHSGLAELADKPILLA